MKIREANFLRWEIFNPNEVDRAMFHIGYFIAGSFLFLPVGIIADVAMNLTYWLPLTIAIISPILTGLPLYLNRLHVLNGVHGTCLQEAGRYLELSKEDRAEFPDNWLETLKNSRLTSSQAYAIDRDAMNLIDSINRRNALKDEINTPELDISEISEQLKLSRRNVESDVEVYRSVL